MSGAIETFPGPGYDLAWTQELGTWTVSAGVVRPGAATTYAQARCDVDCLTAYHRVTVLIAAFGGAFESELGLSIRAQAGVTLANHSYALYCYNIGSGFQWTLQKNVSGVNTRIDSGTNIAAIVPGSVVQLEIDPISKVLVAKLDGTPITVALANDAALTTGTRGGLLLYGLTPAHTGVETWNSEDLFASGGGRLVNGGLVG